MGELSLGTQRAVFEKLTRSKPTLMSGVNLMLQNDILITGLKKAAAKLYEAKNSDYLGFVATYLNQGINTVRRLTENSSPTFTISEATLCLNALQGMIDCLSSWTFEKNERGEEVVNDFQSPMYKDLKKAKELGQKYGLAEKEVRDACSIDTYKIPDDPELSDFKLFDDAGTKEVLEHLRRYELSEGRNKEELYAIKRLAAQKHKASLQRSIQNKSFKLEEKNEQLLDAVMQTISNEFGIGELDSEYINAHPEIVTAMTSAVTNNEDKEVINRVVAASHDRALRHNAEKQATALKNAVNSTYEMGR